MIDLMRTSFTRMSQKIVNFFGIERIFRCGGLRSEEKRAISQTKKHNARKHFFFKQQSSALYCNLPLNLLGLFIYISTHRLKEIIFDALS